MGFANSSSFVLSFICHHGIYIVHPSSSAFLWDNERQNIPFSWLYHCSKIEPPSRRDETRYLSHRLAG